MAACLGALSAGCIFVDDNGGNSGGTTQPPVTPPPTVPLQVSIDTDATITATPGDGVGVFVQYAAGGHWSVKTACDTKTSQVSCSFDLYLSGVDRTTILSNPQGQNLAGRDTIELKSDGTVHLFAETSTGLDGIAFDATPGAPIELEMYLDGAPEARFVYWIGDAVLHTGAPTDPVHFAPTAK